MAESSRPSRDTAAAAAGASPLFAVAALVREQPGTLALAPAGAHDELGDELLLEFHC